MSRETWPFSMSFFKKGKLTGQCSHTFDLWSVVRWNDVSEETRQRHWNDGLHLSQDGYELMGYAVAAHLLELIKEQKET